jgi:hypothetical protein
MARGMSEWRWEVKEGQGRERVLKRSGQMLTRGIVSIEDFTLRGSKVP